MAQQYVIDPRHPKRREREEEQAGNATASVNWDEFTPVSQPISRNVNWDDFTPVDGASPARAERRDGEGGSQIEAFLAGRSPAKAGTIDDFLRGAPSKRSWGEVAQDTAVQLAEGVNIIIGAVPNLVAPESRAAGFFRDNAEFWRERQSDPLKARIARADQAIDAAGEDGVIAQITEAAGQYFSDPALAARFVVTNLPSMIPGIGVAKLSQAAALARGASAAKAASVATTAAGATNAVLNAGGARGEAFEDIKRTLEAQGYSPEQAERLALEDSRVVAAVGGLAGFASGKTGLEGSIVGKVGAGGAVKAGARAAAAELAGEQVEEVAPKIATNVQAGQYDGRAVTQDVGRTIVETAIGSGPGAIVAGGAAAMEARRSTGEAPPSIAHPTMPGSPEDSIRIEPAHDPQPAPTTTGRQMRPEARLAELEMIQLSRPLNEVEIAEAQSLLNEIQAGQSEDLFAQDIAPPELTQEAAPQELTAAPPAVEPAPRSAPIEAQPAPVTQTIAAEDVPDVGAAPAAQPVTQPSVQTQAEPAPTNFWSFAKTKGYKPGQIKIGTPEHTALKAEYDALKAGRQPGAAAILPSVPTTPAAPSQDALQAVDPSLQNRDRSRTASVVQMTAIARNPDYMRLATSRTPDAGAPMVFAVGDDVTQIPEGNAGRNDVAVMADGQRVPFRYAVVDARQVQPSNFADGRPNPAFSAQQPGTLKALNNGRTAGLRAAYEQGTAGTYKAELIADAASHGVPVEAIERTPNPILVRVYSERSNTPDMAAKSQGQGLGMSPTELARQDAPLMDASVLSVYQAGDITSAANRDFVRAFVGKLAQTGQDVATMMTATGELSPAGRQRIQAALMQAAYGDTELVGELFDSLDTDIKAIGEALKTVAGEWANLRDSARQGLVNPDVDITDNLIQAVNLIRKARGERASLYELSRQPDLMTGETPDAVTVGALRFFYTGEYLTRAVGRDSLVAALRDYIRTAMGTSASADMFGQVVTPSDILNRYQQQGNTDAQDPAQEGSRIPDGRSDPLDSTAQARPENERQRGDEAGRRAGADRAGERENPAGTARTGRAQAQEGNEADRLTRQPAGEARIEDVGEQLYANRRNFTGRGIKWADIEGLNDTLKVKEVTKAKVWPRPNYEQLVADGMPPILARMVKNVYDGLSAGPTLRTATPPTDADLKRYIDTLTKVREGLFGFVNDRQQVADFAKGVLTMVKGEPTSLGPVSLAEMSKVAMGAQELQQVLLRRIWPEEYQGSMRPFARGTRASSEVAIIGGNKALSAMQFGREELRKWVADLGKGWPAPREAWQVQGYRILAPGEYTATGKELGNGMVEGTVRPKEGRGSWRGTMKAGEFDSTRMPFVLVQDGGFKAEAFATREAAIEAARAKVKREPGAGHDVRGTNIDEAERTGPARRQDGEDITPQQLMETFGFRGVNFGREGWINQAERQAYINQAYDGLRDLAELLGVPPKAMSLDGKLGIAFGAQGKGRFAAHFVPGVNEINLTKTRGAGTLAHEWAHALDHHFGIQASLEKDEAPFLSEHANKGDTTNRVVFEGGKYVNQKNVPTFGDGIRPEIVHAFRQIYQAMEKRDESPGETALRRDNAKASASKRLNGWIAAARNVIEQSPAHNKADLLAEFDQHAEKLREGDTGDGYAKAGQQVFSARVAAIRNLIKDATGRLWSKDETQGLDSAASYVRSLIGKEEADATHQPQKVSTQYKADSLAMDREKGGKAYWSTPAEMFARAFELYVHDKLSQRGQRNTFLTDAEQRASKPVPVADNSSAMARGAGSTRDLYLYPVGQERETLREAFDNLVEQIKTRETERGVTLFNRKTEDNPTDGTQAQQPTERDRADIADLEAIFDRGNDTAVRAGRARSARAVHPFRWVSLPGVSELGAVASAFGKRVVGFEVAPGVLSQEFGFFNGVTRAGADNRIYINRDADRPHLAILGHEMAHQLARTRPDLYADLVNAVRPYVKAQEYGTRFARSSVARHSYPANATAEQRDAAIREEFVGEILSDGFMERRFWQAVGERNPNLLRYLVEFVGQLIDKIKASVGYTPRTAAYLTDYERVIEIAGAVMAQYGMEAPARPASVNDAPAFNRKTLGGDEPPQIEPPQRNAWTIAKEKALRLTSPEAIDKILYEFQDKLIDLKRLRDHIKALGGTITDLNDAYLGEELYHKRLAKRTQDFLDKELKPLLADMRNRAVSLEQLERYLHARHAPEANKALAERNPTREMIEAGRADAQRQVRDLQNQLQRARRNGSATKAIEQALDQAQDELAKWTGAQAFRGTEAQRLSLSGMSDAEAKAYMDSLTPRKRENLEHLAGMVDAIQGKTLDTLEQYGLVDKATLQAWRDQYQHYVPLHRDEAHADSDRHPIGTGFSVRGTGVKSRVGSNERVTNILAHIAMQRESALTRGEKNLVVKKLYLMAAQNPDEDFWEIDSPPQIKTIDPRTGFVRTGVDPTYKHKPNVLMVRIAGRDQAIVFNEHNPRALRLAEAMKNLDVGDLHVVLGLAAKGTRWFASVNTQYNPIFGLINFARDVQAGLLNLSTTPLAGKQKEVASHVLTAMRAIYRQRRGKSDINPAWTQLWSEFENVGGTTGYRDLFSDAQDRANALAKELKALDRGEVSKAAHAVVDWLSDYNEVMENAVRLAAYKVALEQGMSKDRAASLAKNLTVNFNRKGRQTREIGALYAFFNAAIQGTARMVETLRGPVGKRIMYGGIALGAINTLIGMAMMGAGGDDEDDNWDQIPEFIKERSIIIPLGRQDYVTIPMPLGFHVFPNIGRIAVEFAFGNNDKSAGRQIGKLLMTLVDAFNPLGGAQNLGQMVAPTVIDPVVALMQNRDWTGRPIYRENANGLDPQPGHRMAKDSASTPSRVIAESINKITGGTDYRPGAWSPTPDQLDYVIGQLTGGLGRELLKVNQTIAAPFTGDELPPYKIPLVGRLYGNTRGPAGQAEKFYENVKLLNEIENEYKGRLRNRENVSELRDSEPLLGLIGLGNGLENQVRKLRDMRRRIVERKDPGYQERAKEIDERIGEAMARLNNEVAKARREAAK